MRFLKSTDYRIYEFYLTEGFDECFYFVLGESGLFDIILYLSEDFSTVTIEPFSQLVDLVDFFLEKHSK